MSFPFSFLSGCLLAAAIWYFTWPETEDTTDKSIASPPSQKRPDRVQSPVTFGTLTRETFIDNPKTLKEISHMSSEELEETLDERFSKQENLRLDFPSKLLLVTWTQRAPEEALAWVWDRILSKCQFQHTSWGQCTDLVFSEWAASDPTAASNWIISHIHDNPSPSSSTMHLPSLHFRATWFDHAPVADYLKLYHTVEGNHFHGLKNYLANLEHPDDLQTILTSWDLVPPERIARHDQEIAEEKAAVEKAIPDSREHTGARQSLKWSEEARARTLGEIKNPLIKETIKRWQEIDPEGWARSPFAAKKEWR